MEDQEYIKDLVEVIDGFANMRLEEAGEQRREIKVRMRGAQKGTATGRDTEYALAELSDGQRVLIGLYAVLHFAVRPETTICFDEPDNFIALREVQPWIDRMAFKEGLWFDRPNDLHVRVNSFDDPSQAGLSPSELISRGWDRE
jgi:hypothetical protein